MVNELTVGEKVYINNYPKTKMGTVETEKRCTEKPREIADDMNMKIDVHAKVSSLNTAETDDRDYESSC